MTSQRDVHKCDCFATCFCGTYIAMTAEVLQELDLPQSALGQNLLAEDIGDLLDSDSLSSLIVRGGTRNQ